MAKVFEKQQRGIDDRGHDPERGSQKNKEKIEDEMKKRVSRDWIPFWTDKWIFGSMRIEFNLEERSIWVDFLALGNKDDGWIRANEETPYPLAQLSGMLIIPEDTLAKAIKKFIKKGKLTKAENGTLYIKSWEKYGFTDRHKRRLDDEWDEEDFSKEKDIKNQILNDLDKKNLSYETEKICEAGRIDIFIPGHPNKIIEVKSNGYADSIRTGIRQLLEYAIDFPGSSLFIAFPGDVSTRLKRKLEKYRIEIWALPTKGQRVRQKDTIEEKSIEEESIEEENIEEKRRPSTPPKINFNFKIQQWENIIEKDLERWGKTYPACDVKQELLKMADWLLSHPAKKKKNYKAFISRWLSNQQDRGGTKKGLKEYDWMERVKEKRTDD